MKTSTFFSRLTCGIKYNIYSAVFLLAFSARSHAIVEVPAPVIKSDPMSGSYLMQLVLGLVVVVLCIIALAWFAKKMNSFQSVTDDSLKMISTMSMGTRERIVLLQVGEEQVLIGVSPGRINKLHVLDKPIEKAAGKQGGGTGKGFSEKFKSMMADAKSAADKKSES